MIRIALAALALAGCATVPASEKSQRNRAEMKREQQEERGQALKDEFNSLTNDAS